MAEERAAVPDEQSETTWQQPQSPNAAGLRPARRAAVRVLALVGLLTFNFMVVFVISDAADRVGEQQVLEPPGSREAQIGADHPGETVHIVAAVAAVAIAASGLVGLLLNPGRAGSATHVGAAAVAWLAASVVVGDPDNYGGQASPVDVMFVALAIPALAAAVVAAPWRAWRHGGLLRPRLLSLAALGLPWVWHGVVQGLMQRNTWPPLADPHHQAHWFVACLLSFMTVLVVAASALAGHGWRTAAVMGGKAAFGVAVASFAAPEAASALHPAWAGAAVLWAVAVLAVAWQESRPVPPLRS